MKGWTSARPLLAAILLITTVVSVFAAVQTAKDNARDRSEARLDDLADSLRSGIDDVRFQAVESALRYTARHRNDGVAHRPDGMPDQPSVTTVSLLRVVAGRLGFRAHVAATSSPEHQFLVDRELVTTPEIDAALDRARATGRTVLSPPLRVPGGADAELVILQALPELPSSLLGVHVVPARLSTLGHPSGVFGVYDDDVRVAGTLPPGTGWRRNVVVAGRAFTVAVPAASPSVTLPLLVGLAGGLALVALGLTVGASDRRERAMRAEVDARVAQHVAAESALERQREYSRAVAGALQEGMLVFGPDGVVVEANARITEITGVRRDDLIGASAPLPFWPRMTKRRDASSATFAAAFAGEPGRHEAEFQHATGRRLWLTISSAPLQDDDGAITATVVTFTNVTARYLADHERQVRDTTDSLTGLANHSVFQEHLRNESTTARESGRPLSLVLFDIDYLKRINQVHGHRVGDEVLREASRRVMSCVHPTDLFARVGGEKFALLMPGFDGDEALATAERIRVTVSGLPMVTVGNVTVSIGVASADMAHDGADLYRLADGARYWAKSTGRDRCVRYDPDDVGAMSTDEYQHYIERQGVLSTIRALAKAVDAKDVSTREHSDRVASMAGRIALELGWSTQEADLLYEAGLVHDVGKIGIPDAVLFKPSRLTSDEYELIKKHAPLGAEIVAGALSETQVTWVRGHHERWDGRGYPDGLAGDAIPEGARIMALADAWDVMTVARFYSAPRELDAAVEECLRESGKQFWPPAVEVLTRLVRDGLITLEAPEEPGAAELVPVRTHDAADAA